MKKLKPVHNRYQIEWTTVLDFNKNVKEVSINRGEVTELVKGVD